MLERIIGGGQTGADRGGLDAALESGLPIGGWVPRGRRAEDGTVPEKYAGLLETPTADYRARTERNAKDSDATLIFTHGPLSGGSKLTAGFCEKHGKPWLQIDLSEPGNRDFRFAALDTNYHPGPDGALKHYADESAWSKCHQDSMVLPPEQTAFLEEALATATGPTCVFAHASPLRPPKAGGIVNGLEIVHAIVRMDMDGAVEIEGMRGAPYLGVTQESLGMDAFGRHGFPFTFHVLSAKFSL